MRREQCAEPSQHSTVPSAALRIAIIAHGLRVAGGLSVGLNLLGSILRAAPRHEFFVTIPAGCGYEELCAEQPQCRAEVYTPHGGAAGRLWYDSVRLPKQIAEFRPNVVFAMAGKGLLHPPCPQAAFLQDSHLFYPRRHFARETLLQKAMVAYLKRHMKKQLCNTQLVLCQTDVVARRVRSELGYSGETYVCASAVSPHLANASDPAPMPAALRPHDGKLKLFCLTKYQAHKNLEALVEIYASYSHVLEGTVVLVTVAKDHHRNAGRFMASIEQKGLSESIVNLGPIPHADVGRYYAHVDAMIMPTTLETFGLPYIEAMHYGLPILTSDLDFARAVCGDAAAYFDPWDPASIRDAIIRLRDDAGQRRRLSEAARARAKASFPTWDEIARETMNRLEWLARGTQNQVTAPTVR